MRTLLPTSAAVVAALAVCGCGAALRALARHRAQALAYAQTVRRTPGELPVRAFVGLLRRERACPVGHRIA